MGIRTFIESDENYVKRQDLYEKMIKVCPKEPTEDEHDEKMITKNRYLSFRDRRSTTSSLCKLI